MRAWLVIGIASAGISALIGCAKSELPPGAGMDACFERRALEDWAEPDLPPCSVEHDADADGTIDSAFDSTFDQRGRLIESGTRGERPSEEITYHDYDGTKTTVRFSMDGSVYARLVERYDEHGNLYEVVTDYDGDGISEGVTTHDYDCWPEEPTSKWPGPCSSTDDQDGDGEADFITVREWDERGREVLYTRHDFERDESLRIATRYADDDSWRRSERDDDGDGTIDQIDGTEYDEAGRTLRSWVDDDADGTEDLFEELAYDGEGRMISERRGSQGVEDQLREWEYKDGGRLAIETTFPSEPLWITQTRHIRIDRGGNVIADATDADDDGIADWCTYYSYACLFD